jgi:hypothetical protein
MGTASTSSTPSLAEIARWLSREFPEPLQEYEAGREEVVGALASHLDCSADEAEQLFEELERRGHLRYAAEARSIGGGPGTWVVYGSPTENPDV